MSHNKFARPPALWTNASVPTARDLALFDLYQYQALDGVNGGTWTPATPIVVGGNGTNLIGAGNVVAGGITTSTGGRLELGDSDYVNMSPTRTRTETLSPLGNLGINDPSLFSALPLGMVLTDANQFTRDVPSRYVHDGSVVTSVSFTGIVNKVPATTPSFWPALAFFQIDNDGNLIEFWGTPSSSPSSPSDYYNGGKAQQIVLSGATVGSSGHALNTVVLDSGSYVYAVNISTTDLQTNWLVTALQFNYGNIVDMRPE